MTRYGQWAGGTHPTGILVLCLISSFKLKISLCKAEGGWGSLSDYLDVKITKSRKESDLNGQLCEINLI